jgi:hypothetical protein
MGKQYRDIVKSRYLAERSYLYFQYPGTGGPEIYLPMLENIEISESQRPNYATYDLIGRSGSLFAYLGSKSREFNLKFNITLPNIIDYINNVGLNEMFSNNFRKTFKKSNAFERKKFLSDPKARDKFLKDNQVKHDINFDAYGKAYHDLILINPSLQTKSRKSAWAETVGSITGFFEKKLDFLDFLKPKPDMKKGFPDVGTSEAVNYLILWVNVIRTSTINRADQTHLGPPTIYINHGTMYNNIPCVCTGYSIRINTPIGYELLSLTPRQIEVTLSLSENRTGNFRNFVPFQYIESENLAGWESVVEGGPGTLDPNNQLFRSLENQANADSIVASDNINLFNSAQDVLNSFDDATRIAQVDRINQQMEDIGPGAFRPQLA